MTTEIQKHKENMFTIFIDPGLGGTGVAIYKSTSLYYPSPVYPVKTFVLTAPQKLKWSLRCVYYWKALEKELEGVNIVLVQIESSNLWEANAISHAASVKGDLFKLAYLTGGFGHILSTSPRESIIDFIAPFEWKGQMTKRAVITRIKRRLPNLKNLKDHEADAIGMGLAFQNLLMI